MSNQRRTMLELSTAMSAADVLNSARHFFARRTSIYAAFIEQEGPGYLTLRGQGGEEIVIAADEREGATHVTASTYLFDAQVSRFLSTLPPAASPAGAGAES
ncbi:MAG: hypothetical protein ACT4OZ_11885 [Gemmatimonadota bacterium]